MNPALASRLCTRLGWDDLDPAALRSLIERARDEDLAGYGLRTLPARSGDLSTALLAQRDRPARAALVARQPLVVCGLPLVQAVLDAYGSGATLVDALPDGTRCARGQRLGELRGAASQLLSAERVILNFLQHLSGIATTTRRYVDALGDSPTRLLDTRKTTPGWRVLEKLATATGGGFNHRIGLFDRVMLKDNHLAAEDAAAGHALTALVQRAHAAFGDVVIELEVDHLDQIPPALEAGIDVILLDNFSRDDLGRAVALIGDAAATEASGGIQLDSLASLGAVGLDFISTGATVHQSQWCDIGLDWISSAT